jgi:hypothetical protein
MFTSFAKVSDQLIYLSSALVQGKYSCCSWEDKSFQISSVQSSGLSQILRVTFLMNWCPKTNSVHARWRSTTTLFFVQHVSACKAIFRDSSCEIQTGNAQCYMSKCDLTNRNVRKMCQYKINCFSFFCNDIHSETVYDCSWWYTEPPCQLSDCVNSRSTHCFDAACLRVVYKTNVRRRGSLSGHSTSFTYIMFTHAVRTSQKTLSLL